MLVALFVPLGGVAQSQSRQQALLEYQNRRRQAITTYSENRHKAYADYMRQRWEAYQAYQPIPLPERKEPVEPVVKQPDAPSTPTQDRIVVEEVVDLRTPTPQPQPVAPEKPTQPEEPAAPTQPEKPKQPATQPKQPEKPATPVTPATPADPKVDRTKSHAFTFYGTNCSVSLTPSQRFTLTSVQESAVASAWERLSGGSFDAAARECQQISRTLHLNDWGYYDLSRKLAESFCGKGSNEAVLLHAFLLAEAGYKMRLARGGGDLCLLMALDQKLYNSPYFKIGGDSFYLLDGATKASSYNICNFSIPGEKPLSPTIKELPHLAWNSAGERERLDRKEGITTRVETNRNLMEFLKGYPCCEWTIYATPHLTTRTENQLFPTLKRKIDGQGEREAVQMLLHYLHRAFDYKTDEQQFGRERTLFAEELFYYPFADCEDRSILFARLVRELVGLEVVLLHYPEHIATAVAFREEVKGDYVEVGGRRYVVCDPTYIGSDVGEVMPNFKKISPRIIRVN